MVSPLLSRRNIRIVIRRSPSEGRQFRAIGDAGHGSDSFHPPRHEWIPIELSVNEFDQSEMFSLARRGRACLVIEAFTLRIRCFKQRGQNASEHEIGRKLRVPSRRQLASGAHGSRSSVQIDTAADSADRKARS